MDVVIINNLKIEAVGQSDDFPIFSATHIELIAYAGTRTSTATLQFHINVVEPISGKIIKTYDGVSLALTDAIDSLVVPSTSATGSHIRVTWTGTLAADKYFTGVVCRLIAK